MAVMVVMIGCSFLIAVGFLIAFLWSVKSGQYEDKYTPSVRMLLDDASNEINTETLNNKKKTTSAKKLADR